MKYLILLITAILALPAVANVILPSVFSDHMVLQRNAEVPIWGFSRAGEHITISPSWTDDCYHVVPGSQGTWRVYIPTPDAGGPYDITISGYSTVTLQDVMIGEVWIVSGQSNMEWSARHGINNAEEEVAAANYPDIRLLQVGHATAKTPQQLLVGEWAPCTPETMIDFSAVAYFFGRQLHRTLEVPIGLINASWGGTPAECWTPEQEIRNNPVLDKVADGMKEVPWGPVEPARLWNSMIAPLVPYRIQGALWYQGEANVGKHDTYDDLMETMITGWRKAWGYDFPFYFAQIAPWTYGGHDEGAALRDAQRMALRTPNTKMVVTHDIGDIEDIHPRNKQDVGKRFANLAEKHIYGLREDIVSGPLYCHHETEGSRVRISFKNADNGLVSMDGAPTHFEICGKDGEFYPAAAEIDGSTILVWSSEVDEPQSVRFAWDDIATPNLFNTEGLPASTFNTATRP